MNARRTALAIVLTLSVHGRRPGLRVHPRPDTFPVPPLFKSATPLAVTLTADLGRLKADKDTNAPWRGRR